MKDALDDLEGILDEAAHRVAVERHLQDLLGLNEGTLSVSSTQAEAPAGFYQHLHTGLHLLLPAIQTAAVIQELMLLFTELEKSIAGDGMLRRIAEDAMPEFTNEEGDSDDTNE